MIQSDDEVRRIALEVAEGIFSAPSIVSLNVYTGPDWSGDLVHFLDFTLQQDGDRDIALEKRLRLRRAILEALVAAGDEIYPHVGIRNRATAPAGD